jgi:hypothetical protein
MFPFLLLDNIHDYEAGIAQLVKRRAIFSTMSRPSLGTTQSPTQWVSGAFSLGLKRLKREADHSPPSSAEVKNVDTIPSIPHMSLCVVAQLINHMADVIFYLYVVEYILSARLFIYISFCVSVTLQL